MVSTDTSLYLSSYLFLSPVLLSSRILPLHRTRDTHCMHPNSITCSTIILFPSHLSLSSNSNVFSSPVAAGEKFGCLSLSFSLFAPFLSSSFHLFSSPSFALILSPTPTLSLIPYPPPTSSASVLFPVSPTSFLSHPLSPPFSFLVSLSLLLLLSP